MFKLRDRELAEKILEKIESIGRELTFMHVCGTHQDTLVRHGLLESLEGAGIDVRQGPGCPVCVTLPQEIDETLALARSGKRVTVFGDALKVPGSDGSLLTERSEGGDIRVVYGVDDAIAIAERDPSKETVFMAIGFETTAPTTAAALLAEPPKNFSVLSTHRVMPPALKAILELGEVRLNGLIQPGHVSTIIGTRPYRFISEQYCVPQVVAGFEPIDLLMGIYMLTKQVADGRAEVENEYSRVVREEGNPKALRMLDEVFERSDVAWRGFSVVPGSRLELRRGFDAWNARERYRDLLEEVPLDRYVEPSGCRCGELLRGLSSPEECPLFAKRCTPDTPVGPCMVSREGGCNISFKYRKFRT